jgi:hypothetical protein
MRILLALFIVALSQAVLADDRFRRPEVVHPDGLKQFVLTYRCAVVERLSQIHENQEADTNRYFILALKID